MVPNLGVGGPLRGHKINLRGRKMINKIYEKKRKQQAVHTYGLKSWDGDRLLFTVNGTLCCILVPPTEI